MLQIDEPHFVYYCKSNQFLFHFFQIHFVLFCFFVLILFFFGFFYFNVGVGVRSVRSIEMHEYLIVRVILLDLSKITLTDYSLLDHFLYNFTLNNLNSR